MTFNTKSVFSLFGDSFAFLFANNSRKYAALTLDVTLALCIPVLYIMIRNQYDPLALPLPYVLSLVLFVLMIVVARLRLHVQMCMLRRVIRYSAGSFADQAKMSAIYLGCGYSMALVFFGVMGTHLDLILMVALLPSTVMAVLYCYAGRYTPEGQKSRDAQVSLYDGYIINRKSMNLLDGIAVRFARIV